MFVGFVIPSFYIYMWLLLATAAICLTIWVSLTIYDALRWVWSRLF